MEIERDCDALVLENYSPSFIVKLLSSVSSVDATKSTWLLFFFFFFSSFFISNRNFKNYYFQWKSKGRECFVNIFGIQLFFEDLLDILNIRLLLQDDVTKNRDDEFISFANF